jgi:hypothetical protein
LIAQAVAGTGGLRRKLAEYPLGTVFRVAVSGMAALHVESVAIGFEDCERRSGPHPYSCRATSAGRRTTPGSPCGTAALAHAPAEAAADPTCILAESDWRKAGQKRPGIFALSDAKPPLGNLTKAIDLFFSF